MASKTVETEALGQAASALHNYIAEIQGHIKKMRDAAIDCSDNMGSDVYSQKAINQLEECIAEISKTIVQAEDLAQIILKKKNELEESINSSN